MDYSDYDDEGWNLDDYNDMNEQAPEALPLETILEENSLIKDSPPPNTTTKTQATTKHARPASGNKTSKTSTKRTKSPSRRSSPSKNSKSQAASSMTYKAKTMH